MNQIESLVSSVQTLVRPRLGFLGVGWIGQKRLQAVAQSGLAEIAMLVDPQPDSALPAAKAVPGAMVSESFDALLDAGVDGIVIATPNALHANQAITALEHGIAVFCQKPLGRNGQETACVVDAARAANRLLGVDFSYRHTNGMRKIRQLIQEGAIGQVYALDLAFHNAYGPDKPWYYDRRTSGGGCVIDLGIHLVDLVLWTLNNPLVVDVSSRLYAHGRPMNSGTAAVEDYALARLDFADGAVAQLACSWKAHAGCDAVIRASFYGTRGGATWRNVNGSFYDFVAERFDGTNRELLTTPLDAWSGRAVVDWARRLAAGEGFDPDIEDVCYVANIVDAIYS